MVKLIAIKEYLSFVILKIGIGEVIAHAQGLSNQFPVQSVLKIGYILVTG